MLALSIDSTQRTAMNVATQQSRVLLEKGMLYLGRYETADAVMIHESETSLGTNILAEAQRRGFRKAQREKAPLHCR